MPDIEYVIKDGTPLQFPLNAWSFNDTSCPDVVYVMSNANHPAITLDTTDPTNMFFEVVTTDFNDLGLHQTNFTLDLDGYALGQAI